MQQLLPATNERTLGEECARLALLAIPGGMRFIRQQMRRNRGQDLTVPQFRSLIFVHYHPEGSLSPLADHIGLSLPAASRMVDGLVRRGLLIRKSHSGDRRCVRLALTARGNTVFRLARESTHRALAERMKSLPHRDLRMVRRALQIILDTLAHRDEVVEPGPRKRRSAS
jgi:DNA-binding MarR family transcriptional regulator